jgi:hypothetical protein
LPFIRLAIPIMATVQDIEASKNSTDANHTDVGGLPSQQKGIKEGFEDLLSYNRKIFEISQKGSEERLGVLLLLHYKSALDKLNLQYREFSEAKRVPDREVMETAGQYSRYTNVLRGNIIGPSGHLADCRSFISPGS